MVKFQVRLYSYISRKTSLKICCAVFSFALSRSFWLFIRVYIVQMSRVMVYTVSTERKNILEQVTRDISESLLLLQKIRHLKRQANTKKMKRHLALPGNNEITCIDSEVTTPEKNDN